MRWYEGRVGITEWGGMKRGMGRYNSKCYEGGWECGRGMNEGVGRGWGRYN